MVTGGVAGEMVFEAWSFHKEGQLEQTHSDLDKFLQKKAESAETAANGAINDFNLAQAQLSGLSLKAGQLDRQLDAEEAQLIRTGVELAAAKTQLESTEARRAELEKSLVMMEICSAPRVVPVWSIGNKETSVDPLKSFMGFQAIIEYVPDTEALRAAGNIAGALDKAGWKLIRVAAKGGIKDGVEIQPYVAPLNASQAEWSAETQSGDAAYALVDFLHSYNWQAMRGWPIDKNGKLIRDANVLPPNSIRIQVGLYPPVTFVSPPGARAWRDAIAQFDKEREESRKKIDEEQSKREAEMLKRMTPKEASFFQAAQERWKAEQEQYKERYSEPCQSLSGLTPRSVP